MPVGKKRAERAALEELHGRIARRVFKPREDGAKTAKRLKILEEQGLVIFVPGVGWVDSKPAIHRYRLYTGIRPTTEDLLKIRDAAQKAPEESGATVAESFVQKRDRDWDLL